MNHDSIYRETIANGSNGSSNRLQVIKKSAIGSPQIEIIQRETEEQPKESLESSKDNGDDEIL